MSCGRGAKLIYHFNELSLMFTELLVHIPIVYKIKILPMFLIFYKHKMHVWQLLKPCPRCFTWPLLYNGALDDPRPLSESNGTCSLHSDVISSYLRSADNDVRRARGPRDSDYWYLTWRWGRGGRVDAVIYSDNIVAKNPPPSTRKELN